MKVTHFDSMLAFLYESFGKLLRHFIALLFPFFAALGKALGNAYGVLFIVSSWVFVNTFSIQHIALLSFFALITFFSVFIVSLNMEGREAYRVIFRCLGGSIEAPIATSNLPDKKRKKLNNRAYLSKNLFKLKSLLAFLAVFLVGLAKGMTMTYGFIHLFNSHSLPILILLIICLTLIIASVSVAKEGRLLIERCSDQNSVDIFKTKTKSLKPHKKSGLFGRLLAKIAAVVKGFGYSYGTFQLLFSILHLSCFMAIICVAPMFFSVFFISWNMEGKALEQGCLFWFQNSEIHRDEDEDKIKLSGKSFCIYSVIIPFFAAFAKGSTMAYGTYKIVTYFLPELPLYLMITIVVLSGIGVFSVSACKEGVKAYRKIYLLEHGYDKVSSQELSCYSPYKIGKTLNLSSSESSYQSDLDVNYS